jgi:GNAT superfamily N-acetyltransferase
LEQGCRRVQNAAGVIMTEPDESRPLADPTESELETAFAENLFELFRSMAQLPGAELEESDRGSRHRAFPFSPMFTGLWRHRLRDHDVEAAIHETEAWLRAREAPFAFWWVDPQASPPDLGLQLERHGWVPWELGAPGMAAVLSDLRFDLMTAVPPGYTQELVHDAAGLADFKEAFVTGFEVPDWAGQAWVDATRAFGIGATPWQMYVGRLDGRPVASNMLFIGAGVAGVFGVATLPEARSRGIGAAITLAAYADARDQGLHHGVLFGTELGAPVYRRIGFRDVGVGMSRYLWQSG